MKQKPQMTIAVAGIGYVGLSLAVLLAQNHRIYAVDIVLEKVEQLRRKEAPVTDRELRSTCLPGS